MTAANDSPAKWLDDCQRAGVVRSDEETAQTAFSAGASRGFNAYRIDLSQATTAKRLLQIFGRSLRFPEWYGANWDALIDCLTDLSWSEANGYVLILQRLEILAALEPESVDTLLEILSDTADFWRAHDIPFWVLVLGDQPQLSASRSI